MAPGRAIGKDVASVVIEDPSLKRLRREVKVWYRVAGFKFLKTDSTRVRLLVRVWPNCRDPSNPEMPELWDDL